MKLVFSCIAALAATSHGLVRQRRATAGFCDDKLAGNYQHDTEALDSGFYYTCATDESSDPLEFQCPMNATGFQMVYNPNNGNADCSIVSPGGYCDHSDNVDFSAGNGLDAAIDCPIESSGDDATTVAATTAGATTNVVVTTADPTTVAVTTPGGTTAGATTAAPATMPAGYSAVHCASMASGNHVFEESCAAGYYYQCSNGFTYLQQCPAGTVFDLSTESCNWADEVGDCASVDEDNSSATTAAATTAAPGTTAEVQSCDFEWGSETMGQCVTSNWCSGKDSGYYQPDDTTACESGTYYMCNWGVYTELTCGAGFRWNIPNPAPEWATQWYGYCDVQDNVTC